MYVSLIAYRLANYIFDMFQVLLYLLYSRVSKTQTNSTSRVVVIVFMNVLNFGSNILAWKFLVSSL